MPEEGTAPAIPKTSEEEARTEEDSGTKKKTEDEEEGKTEENSETKTNAKDEEEAGKEEESATKTNAEVEEEAVAEEEADAEEESGNSAAETGSGICGFICCSLPVAIAAIVIASRYLDDPLPACREDAVWLLVFGINVIVYGVLGLMASLATGKPAFVYIKALGGLFSMYKFGWSIYGIVLFTREESKECASQLHTFGYVLAIITMIAIALVALLFCCLMCCAGGFLGAAFMEAAAEADEEAQEDGEAADKNKTDPSKDVESGKDGDDSSESS